MAAMPTSQAIDGAISGTSGPPDENSTVPPVQTPTRISTLAAASNHSGSPAMASATPAALMATTRVASPPSGRRGLSRPSSICARMCASISTPGVEELASDSGERCWSMPAKAVPIRTSRPASHSFGSTGTASAE